MNKSYLAISLFVFALCTIPITVTPAQDITSDLEGYWNFDEYDGGAAVDASGNGRDAAVLAGEPLPAAGKKGNGVFFDGGSDFQVPWEGVQGNDPRTIVCWIKTTDVGYGLVGWGESGTAIKWHFRINDSTNQPDESTYGCIRTEYQGSQTIASTPVNDGEWHLVASVFEGLNPSDVVHYVDGELDPNGWVGDDTLEIDTQSNAPEHNVTIGSRLQGTSYNRVIGVMDEVRIYSRALSADDIKALYDEAANVVQLVAERSFSKHHAGPGGSIEVTVNIPEGADGMTLIEELPSGWSASDASDGGTIDANTITWDVSAGMTAVTYTATVSEGANDVFGGNLGGIITGGDRLVTILSGSVGEFDFHADIGDTGIEGEATYNSDADEYSVIGGGADIWGTADGFHFAFDEVEGPFIMRGNAIIFNIDSTNDWSKGGLMIRNNLTPGSSYGYNLVRGVDLQMASQARSSQGSSAFTVVDLTDDQFGDMEIERKGKVINFYRLDAAGERQSFGSVELEDLEDPVYAGLACTSHELGALSELLFLNFELELLDFSATRTMATNGGLMFGDSANVTVNVFYRDTTDVDITEDIPEGWTVSDIDTSDGEASTNGDGDLEWTISGHQGEATITYSLTAPDSSDSPVIEDQITGTVNGNEIEGQTELFVLGYVAQDILDQQDIESNIELYINFDNWDGSVAADQSDNGYDATLITDSSPTSTDDAIKGQALDFDGNSTLSVPWTGVQGDTPRTISLWMKTTEGGPIFVAWGNDVEGQKWHFRINDSSDNGNVDTIRTEYAGGNQTCASTPVNDGEWHHIVSVFGGVYPKDVRHYVDGLYDPNSWYAKEETVIDTLSDEGNNVHIGSDPGGGRMFGGVMDELRIYSRALSDLEVQALYIAEGGERPTSIHDFMLY